jgi:hypothetical protein
MLLKKIDMNIIPPWATWTVYVYFPTIYNDYTVYDLWGDRNISITVGTIF